MKPNVLKYWLFLALSVIAIACGTAAPPTSVPTVVPTSGSEPAVTNTSTPIPTAAPTLTVIPTRTVNVKAAADRPYRLTILHNNDGESQLVDLGSDLHDFGGVARFAAVVQREKEGASGESNAGAIMVSSGDNSLAGHEFTAGRQAGTYYDALALDLIGYDAIALGNHDFDFGPEVLAEFIRQVSASEPPFLSSNLDFAREPSLQALFDQGRIAESVVVDKNGEKIGIIGATTPTLRIISSPRNVRIIDDVAAEVQTEVDRLERMGINKIVLISHLQDVGADIALLKQLEGVDIAVAGGGDDLLANEGDLLVPGDEDPVGPYPIIATDRDGTAVPVVTTAGQYSYLGKLVVTFDANGHLIEIDDEASGPIRIAGGNNPDAIAPDPTAQERVVDQVVKSIIDIKNEIIATSQVNLEGRRSEVRSRETNQGNLMADALRWQAIQLAAEYGVPSPDVAIQNGGGIRNDVILSAGPISKLDTFDMAPFSNFVTVVEGIYREQFKQILENAISQAVEGDTEEGSGRFAQVSGFRFEWSESGTAQVLNSNGTVAVPGTRVQRLVLDDGTVIVYGGIVVPGPALTVATLDFLAQGGDEYPYRGAPFTKLGTSYQEALANYIHQPNGLNGTVTADDYPEGGEGRIRRLP